MQGVYILLGLILLGGYLALHVLRLRRTRRVEAQMAVRREAPPAPDGGPLLPPDVTREMLQEDRHGEA